jgi:capsular exopolysaccharide synthesis family protein
MDWLPAAAPAASRAPGGLDLKQLWGLVRRRWLWIAAAALVGVGLGVAKYLTSPKLYRATTQIQIEPRNLVPVGQDRNPWIEQWTNMKYFPTQYRLLRSRGLAERVIDDLRLETDPAFVGSATRKQDRPFTPDEDARYRANLANRLISGLRVNPLAGTELLNLEYVATDPKLAADIANGFAAAFINWGMESRSETLRQANRVLNTQIDNLRHDVEALEVSIQEFSRESAVSAADAGSGAISQRVASLNEQYATASATALSKQQRLSELASMPDTLVADSFGRPAIAALEAELEGHRRDYETRLQTFKPDHPDMVELKRTVDSTQRRYEQEVAAEAEKLRQAARTEWQAAQRLVERIERQRNDAQAQSLAQNVEVLPLTNMHMELSAKRQRLSERIESESQADLSADVQSEARSNVHVIDHALVPGGPFRPSLRQNVGIGGSAGLLIGLGVVFLFHFLDRTIKSAEELERLLSLPVLAAIPNMGSDGQSYGYHRYYGYSRKRRAAARKEEGPVEIELLPETRPRLAVSEAYRSLRTALLLSSADDLKLITVTSAEASEGKSVTSTNLGVVMAQLGKRVLIIDGDLRKPRLHRIFDAPNSQGIVNCLAAGTHPESLVQPTAVSGLFLLPAGSHPPNPSELLASDRMRQLTGWARENFDFTIIDTPPVLAVSDAILPGAMSDGIVLCFKANQIERETARRCTEQLRLAGIKVLGIVLNRYQPGGSRYYDRRYQTYEAYAESQAESQANSAA